MERLAEFSERKAASTAPAWGFSQPVADGDFTNRENSEMVKACVPGGNLAKCSNVGQPIIIEDFLASLEQHGFGCRLKSTNGDFPRHDENLREDSKVLSGVRPVVTAKGTSLQWILCESGGEHQVRDFVNMVSKESKLPAFTSMCVYSEAYLARWLFEQPRGWIMQSCVLLCSWRAAKPCAMAIEAVISGDTGRLRVDGMRPSLRPLMRRPMWTRDPGSGGDDGNGLDYVRCIVAALVVCVMPFQERKARYFAKNKQIPGVQVLVCASPEELESVAQALTGDDLPPPTDLHQGQAHADHQRFNYMCSEQDGHNDTLSYLE